MNVFYYVCVFIAVILNIAVLIAFFKTASAVMAIRRELCTIDPSDISDKSLITLRLSGSNTDKAFFHIVNTTVNRLETDLQVERLDWNELQKDLFRTQTKKQIATAMHDADVLGRQFPKELCSIEAYKEYRDSISVDNQ